MSTTKPRTLDEVRDVLNGMQIHYGHDYRLDAARTFVSRLRVHELLLPMVMDRIGPGWESEEVSRVRAPGDVGMSLLVNLRPVAAKMPRKRRTAT